MNKGIIRNMVSVSYEIQMSSGKPPSPAISSARNGDKYTSTALFGTTSHNILIPKDLI